MLNLGKTQIHYETSYTQFQKTLAVSLKLLGRTQKNCSNWAIAVPF